MAKRGTSEEARDRVRNALPASQQDLCEKLQMSRSTVCRAVKHMVDEGEIHVAMKLAQDYGKNPHRVAIYAPGPAPNAQPPKRPRREMGTNRPARSSTPDQHYLVAALFGRAF